MAASLHEWQFVIGQIDDVARLLRPGKCQQDTVAQPKHCVHTWDSLSLLLQRGGIREPRLRFLMLTVFH
jgi:hypothetical protein